MIKAQGISGPGSALAHRYLVTTELAGMTWHRELTPEEAASLAEDLLIVSWRLLADNPEGRRHNTIEYIHDLAAIADAWARGERASDAAMMDAAAQRAEDCADDDGLRYEAAGSPNPRDP